MAAAAIAAAAATRPIAAILHVVAAAKPAGRVPALVTLKRCAPVLRAQTRPPLPVRLLRTQLLAAVAADIKAVVAVAVVADIKLVAAAVAAVGRTVVVAGMKAAEGNNL